MKKVRIGVLGGARGASMINFCTRVDNAEVVAICDKNKDVIKLQKEVNKDYKNIKYFDDFDEFIKYDMDAVVLANYAHEHAPFAIKAMKEGKHVFSEVLPVQTMKEAVELIETVEETGMIYAYGENYCYMQAPYEMRKLYKEGVFGEFEYGEGEYIHNCESIWPGIAYGDKNHWRNKMYSTFYCTHSLGPIIHITGLRPVSVIGIEGCKNERHLRMGSSAGQFAIEMVTLENGGIVKSIHGGLYVDSIWYCIYGSKGGAEASRYAAGPVCERILSRVDDFDGEYKIKGRDYVPQMESGNKSDNDAHGGSDFYSMYYFVNKILGDKDADIIDVYEAMDMFLPGLFAYRSILNGGKSMEIPNLRDKKERDKWRNDTACTDEKIAGDMLLPMSSKGTVKIDDAVYDRQKELYNELLKDENSFIYQWSKIGREDKKKTPKKKDKK